MLFRSALGATRAGRIFSATLVGLGVVAVAGRAVVSGIWLMLLGWFLLDASRAEESRIIVGRDLAGVRVRAVMTNDPWTLPASMTVADALAGPVLAHRCSAFPVVEAEGTVVGLVTLRDLRGVPADRRGEVVVAEAALPVAEVSRDRKSTRLNSSHSQQSRMPSSA